MDLKLVSILTVLGHKMRVIVCVFGLFFFFFLVLSKSVRQYSRESQRQEQWLLLIFFLSVPQNLQPDGPRCHRERVIVLARWNGLREFQIAYKPRIISSFSSLLFHWRNIPMVISWPSQAINDTAEKGTKDSYFQVHWSTCATAIK